MSQVLYSPNSHLLCKVVVAASPRRFPICSPWPKNSEHRQTPTHARLLFYASKQRPKASKQGLKASRRSRQAYVPAVHPVLLISDEQDRGGRKNAALAEKRMDVEWRDDSSALGRVAGRPERLVCSARRRGAKSERYCAPCAACLAQKWSQIGQSTKTA